MITLVTKKGREYTVVNDHRTLGEMLADELEARGIGDGDKVIGYWKSGRYYKVEA